MRYNTDDSLQMSGVVEDVRSYVSNIFKPENYSFKTPSGTLAVTPQQAASPATAILSNPLTWGVAAAVVVLLVLKKR